MAQASWYPGAIRVLGPRGRVSGSQQPKHGAIYHSMVGSVRPAQTAHSWHFSVFKTGRIEQHYPAKAWCWHAGDRDDPAGDISNNRDLIGIEHEGGRLSNVREPLTTAQVAADIRLTAWLVKEDHIHKLTRIGSHRGLWEHNEIRNTACPSGRIPWVRIIAGVQAIEGGGLGMATAFRVAGQGTTVWLWNGTELSKYSSGAAFARDKRLKLISAKTPILVASVADFKSIRAQLRMDR